MNVRRHQFFASPGFAREENARIGTGYKRCLLDSVLENRARSDHFRAVADDFPEAFVLAPESGLVQRVFDDDQNFVASEWLLQKIEGTRPNGFDCMGNGSVPGNHDYGNLVLVYPKEPKHIDPVTIRQSHVDKASVRTIRRDTRAEFGDGFANEHVVTFAFEDHLQRKADVRFVINN
jgi:hypothetical protein